jgi:hypothetical protein
MYSFSVFGFGFGFGWGKNLSRWISLKVDPNILTAPRACFLCLLIVDQAPVVGGPELPANVVAH